MIFIEIVVDGYRDLPIIVNKVSYYLIFPSSKKCFDIDCYIGTMIGTKNVDKKAAVKTYKEIRVKANTGISVSDVSH